jgi:23S rRNA (adenine2030-N6)-methyltransferase
MNYRHAYHAGNFADVLKHVVLTRVIEYLKRKPAPLRIVDTHAGSGCYALHSEEAAKTGEWQAGIGRLLGSDARPLPAQVAALLSPYLDAVRAENDAGALGRYPGSPLLACRLMRADDRLVANELHPEEHAALTANIGRDRRAKVLQLDGWLALKSQLPPRERRGVVLIDPPFEQDGELARMAQGLAEGLQRFATGVYLAWYPIKDPKPIARFHRDLVSLPVARLLRIELMLRRPTDLDRLNGCGLIVANPPHVLEAELARILPVLARRLGGDDGQAHVHLAPIGINTGGRAHQSATSRIGKRSTA